MVKVTPKLMKELVEKYNPSGSWVMNGRKRYSFIHVRNKLREFINNHPRLKGKYNV